MHWVNYLVVIGLFMVGIYMLIAHDNLIRKVIGLNIFQVAIFMLYISLGKVADGSAPIIEAGVQIYSSPLPHVLILTAIVVSVATTALALALIVKIHKSFGTIEASQIDLSQD